MLPGSRHRTAIVGRTGTGKTQAGAALLARMNFDKQPWIIVDYKRDKLLNSIRGVRPLAVGATLPREPGLYITHPKPGVDDEAITDMLWGLWEQENTGLFLDEGYMLGNRNSAFRALLTQGRSKNIPMIVLSQRPVYMDLFVFSEADYFMAFGLTVPDDKKRISAYMHPDIDFETALPEHCSWYYSVANNEYCCLKPWPDALTIKRTFRERIVSPRRRL